ncbi:MAG: hypothetical protein WCI27_05380 [Candidatus Omnitrophota bacterium]
MRKNICDMNEELFVSMMLKKELVPLDAARVAEERRYYEMTPSVEGKDAAIRDLAEVYADAGAYDDAIAVYQEAIQNPIFKEYRAGYYFRIGQLNEHKEDFDSALVAYLQSLNEEEFDAYGRYWQHNNVAFCYLMKKDFVSAEKHCLIAFEADDEFRRRWIHVEERLRWNVWKNMGVAMEHTGRYKEAASFYTTAIKLSDGSDRAVVHLRRLLNRHPDLAVYWKESVEDLLIYYNVIV